jgi:hypothetical protein
MMEAAAEELEVDRRPRDHMAGSIRVKGAPHRSISVRGVAIAARFRWAHHSGRAFSGAARRGSVGEMSPATCRAHACLIAVVEATTAACDVLKMTRLRSGALFPALKGRSRRRLDGHGRSAGAGALLSGYTRGG